MKTSKRENIISLVESIETLREEKKALESQLKEYTESLKGFMGDEHALSVPGYVAILNDRERRSFDRKKLTELLGDNVSNFERVSSYQTLEIKRA